MPNTTRTQSGFTVIELMLGLALLAVGLLSHVVSVMGHHRLSAEERERSEALQVVSQLVARLRADEDFAGLYARLRTRTLAASAVGPLAPGTVRLDDGRRAYLPSSWYADFSPSPVLRDVHALIEVPLGAATEFDPPEPWVLREDIVQGAFGLPADLNGDGVVDASSRDGDYLALPVRLIVRWQPTSEAPRELSVVTWIGGGR